MNKTVKTHNGLQNKKIQKSACANGGISFNRMFLPPHFHFATQNAALWRWNQESGCSVFLVYNQFEKVTEYCLFVMMAMQTVLVFLLTMSKKIILR